MKKGQNNRYTKIDRQHFCMIMLKNSALVLALLYLCASCAPQAERVRGAILNQTITINSTRIDTASLTVVIPRGKKVTVSATDDSYWNTYYRGNDILHRGVFINGRSVTLAPFAIGQYEVTQELYQSVTEKNPSTFISNPAAGELQEKRPVDGVSWYDAAAFCNALTQKIMHTADCVYFSDNRCTTPYTQSDALGFKKVFTAFNKKGYRLPTEAEWEFAARGGNPGSPHWYFAYSGVQSKKPQETFTFESLDSELNDYAWYAENSAASTHQTGLKKPNDLNLYDMSGNVWEWCHDSWGAIEKGTVDESRYQVECSAGDKNPVGNANPNRFVKRGGRFLSFACNCSVSKRIGSYPGIGHCDLGFRICRSL